MVYQEFDYIIASFDDISEVVVEEIVKADIVQIRGFVPGGIYHSSHMNWSGTIDGITQPQQFIRSKKERKAILKNKQRFEDEGYHFEVKPLTEEIFRDFKVVYERTTLQLKRAVNYNVDKVLDKIRMGIPTYIVGMYEEKDLQSALLFSVKKDKASVSFGAKHKFRDRRGGVGGVLELELMRYCLEQGIPEIGHGRAPNPTGITSSAGVFEFKTRYGFSAFPTGVWQTTFIQNPDVALSDMVFVTIADEQLCYLVVTDKSEKEVKGCYKSRDVQLVKAVSKDEVRGQYQRFIKGL